MRVLSTSATTAQPAHRVYSATSCSTGLLETYAYDAAGNRTSAAGRTYTYSTSGQLATCSGVPACTPTFDADGRLTRITEQFQIGGIPK